eukprot:COSAG02_NODE_9999_length_2054_cov_2.420972_2_plen_253_part_00
MRTALAAATIAVAMLGADAVPAHGLLRSSIDVATTQDISTAGSLSAVENTIATSMSSQFGYDVDVSISGAEGHRRLQAGTSLSISYTIMCGSSCDAVADRLSTIANDPAAGIAHAQSIIAAVNSAAASSGFGNDVVTSSPSDVAATIVAPDTVSITLPPSPSPPPAPPPGGLICHGETCHNDGHWVEVAFGEYSTIEECQALCACHQEATSMQYNDDGWCGCMTLDDVTFADAIDTGTHLGPWTTCCDERML